MSVILKYPSTGAVTHSVTLAGAAHGSVVEVATRQYIGRTPSGTPFVHSHGGVYYKITRRFESLTEDEAKALVDFLAVIRHAAGEIIYEYVDGRNGNTKQAFCRIVSPNDEMKLMRNIRDVSLVFEQRTHPNRDRDTTSATSGTYGGGSIGSGATGAPVITSELYASVEADDAFSYTITATGDATITFEEDDMPAFLSLNAATGEITGTPDNDDVGTYEFTIRAVNGVGNNERTLRVVVIHNGELPPDDPIAPELFPDAYDLEVWEGFEFELQIAAGGTSPRTFVVDGEPDWVIPDLATGELTGTAAVREGETNCTAEPNYPAADEGEFYRVTHAGKIGGAAGKTVAIGDYYYAIADNAGGDEAAVGADWIVLPLGVFPFDVSVSNDAGSDGPEEYGLKIKKPTPPTITSAPSAEVVAGGLIEHEFTATGTTTDLETFAWSIDPADLPLEDWMEFDFDAEVGTAFLTVQSPSTPSIQLVSLTIIVETPAGTDTQEFEIQIGEPAEITSIDDDAFTMHVDDGPLEIYFTYEGEEPVVLSLDPDPGFVTLDPEPFGPGLGIGLLTFEPAGADAGLNTFDLVASNVAIGGVEDRHELNVTVTITPAAILTCDTPPSTIVLASDNDDPVDVAFTYEGTEATVSLVGAPAWATLVGVGGGSGTVRLDPAAADSNATPYAFTLKVENDVFTGGAEDTQAFSVTVSVAPATFTVDPTAGPTGLQDGVTIALVALKWSGAGVTFSATRSPSGGPAWPISEFVGPSGAGFPPEPHPAQSYYRVQAGVGAHNAPGPNYDVTVKVDNSAYYGGGFDTAITSFLVVD